MIKEILRILAAVLLVIIIVMDDFPFYNKMKDTATQLLLAVLVIFCVFFDPIFGLIMGLVLLLVYYESYKKIINIQDGQDSKTSELSGASRCTQKLDYITEQHLLAAQNNIVDINNYYSEIKGIHEIEGSSAQGLGGGNGQRGYETDDKYAVI